MRKAHTFSLAIITAVAMLGCAAAGRDPQRDYTVEGGKTSISLPFDLVDNRIVIEAKLNGKGPFRLIFDTGAVAVISPEVARELGLKVEYSAASTGGVGEKAVERGDTKISEIEVAGVRLGEQDFGVISFADSRYVFGSSRIDGIIGYPLFNRLVVQVDYEQKRLTFWEPSAFAYKGSGTVVPLDFDRHLPIVKGELDGVAGRFVIDTGARSALILYGPFVERNNLREKYHASFEGITGWGIGGPVRSQLVRIRNLKLGAVEIRDLIARLSTQKSGALATGGHAALVGPDVLDQFTTIFDYSRRRVIFERNGQYGRRDSYDRAGMWFGQDGDRFEVIDVISGGPAFEAGVRAGDRIVEVDGKSARLLDLHAVRLRFKSEPPGRRVRLTVDRNGERREMALVLRDLV